MSQKLKTAPMPLLSRTPPPLDTASDCDLDENNSAPGCLQNNASEEAVSTCAHSQISATNPESSISYLTNEEDLPGDDGFSANIRENFSRAVAASMTNNFNGFHNGSDVLTTDFVDDHIISSKCGPSVVTAICVPELDLTSESLHASDNQSVLNNNCTYYVQTPDSSECMSTSVLPSGSIDESFGRVGAGDNDCLDDFGDFSAFDNENSSALPDELRKAAGFDPDWASFDNVPHHDVPAINLTSDVHMDVWPSLNPQLDQNQTIPVSVEALIDDCFVRSVAESFVEEKTDDFDALNILLGELTNASCASPAYRIAAKIWHNLRSIEDSSALKFCWTDSQSQQEYFDAIHISAAVAKQLNSNLPAFAAQLGVGAVLTPVVKDVACASGTETVSGEITVVTSVAQMAASCAGQMAIQDSLAVPPVEFDWSSSGLTNPLPGYASQSVLLDLDFLANAYSSSLGGSALKKDLDRFGLSDLEKPSTNLPLESLKNAPLSSATNFAASDSTNRASSNNPEVVCLLGKLPDLSFMLSPVLMFPIRSDNLNSVQTSDQRKAHQTKS